MSAVRVLLVTARVAGGVGRHVQLLAAGLTGRGHRVVVACPAQVADRFDLAGTGAGVAVLDVGDRPHPVRDLRAVHRLRVLAAGADVVHAHGARAGALAALALRRSGPPLVLTSHNAPPEGTVGAVLYAVTERVAVTGADEVLGVSPDLVDRARRAGARRTADAVVPAAPAGPVPGGPARAALDAELGLPADARVVLVVGRLAPQKGLDLAVRAVAGLDRALAGAPDPVHLVVAGEGPVRDALAAAAGRAGVRLHLLGHRDDIPSLLAAADVVLSTARWEGQPVWLQEALQQGAAVVATEVGGTARVVGDAALLVPPGEAAAPGTAAAVTDALHRVLTDPGLRHRLRRRAAARAARLPGTGQALDAAEAAYRRATGGAAVRPARGRRRLQPRGGDD